MRARPYAPLWPVAVPAPGLPRPAPSFIPRPRAGVTALPEALKMDPNLIVLHLMKDKLKLLSDSANKSIKETLDNIDTDSRTIQEAEIISSQLQALLNTLTSEMTNYFRMCKETAPDDISEICTVQLQVEDTLCELNVKIKNKSKVIQTNNDNNWVSGRLPKFDLPVFDGNILEWHTFWDQFSCNIHNRNLSDVDKLLYLKSFVRGGAKKEIEGLPTTEQNYQIAVRALKDRYGKPTQIVDARYRALYRIKTSDKSTSDCRRTLNEVERHLRVLHSLGEDINHNHLRFLVMEKFPEDVIYEMRTK
ncbi:uncharacterized protein LOC113238872, partial [Hyposmocoma kahamanoa]|uniref:uncharacterized protein LOC113238872 n=1 Tax=Hyposmocoma kahamanoa TaxID=1477025 RepID=UPI000E6D7AAB